MTTDLFDGTQRTTLSTPDPEWPAILSAFRALDGNTRSWMTVVQGDNQLTIGGGRSGYVVVAQRHHWEILKGLERQGFDKGLEFWLGGVRRPCPAQELHDESTTLMALKAFVLAGELSSLVCWQAA